MPAHYTAITGKKLTRNELVKIVKKDFRYLRNSLLLK